MTCPSEGKNWNALPGSAFATTGRDGARPRLPLLTLQKLSNGAELICKFEQGSPCIEFLSFASKGSAHITSL
jgi:hypothetical protein